MNDFLTQTISVWRSSESGGKYASPVQVIATLAASEPTNVSDEEKEKAKLADVMNLKRVFTFPATIQVEDRLVYASGLTLRVRKAKRWPEINPIYLELLVHEVQPHVQP